MISFSPRIVWHRDERVDGSHFPSLYHLYVTRSVEKTGSLIAGYKSFVHGNAVKALDRSIADEEYMFLTR